MATTLTTATAFFYQHAGYSYNPAKETAEQGRIKCAKALAIVERKAHSKGFYYRWSIDPLSDTGSDWQCCMYNADGGIVNSLHGIGLGDSGEPWGNPYRRVVEAELAIDGLTNTPQ